MNTVRQKTCLILLSTIYLASGSPVSSDEAASVRDKGSGDQSNAIIQIEASVTSSAEDELEAVYQLELSEPWDRPIAILYSTIAGTAIAGVDFVELSGVMTVPAGAVSAELRIPLVDDDLPEGEETFSLYLTTSPEVARLTTSSIETVIADDDLPSAVSAAASSLDNGSANEPEALSGQKELPRDSRIVLHYNGSVPFEDVVSIRERLEQADYPQPELRSVGFRISKTNIRYFFEDDHDSALDVDRLIREMTGKPSWGPRDFTDYTPPPVPGTIEVWLEGDPKTR